MDNALVTVAILSYRRREALSRTLDSVVTQVYEPLDVVVVDNCSGDDTPDFVRENYPQVRLISLQDNTGTGGRNRGVEAARGELVVMLDNDVSLDSPFEVRKAVNVFERRPDASCLVFKVLEGTTGRIHQRDWCHPRTSASADSSFETWFIAEGACAFRKADFLRVGGYYEPFWIGGEGWDLALRLLDHGRRIYYEPSVRVRHVMSSETRKSWRPYYYYTRNYLWIAARLYPSFRGLRFLAEKLAMLAYFAARTENLWAFARGIAAGLRGLPEIRKTRKPASAVVWRTLEELSRERSSLVSRLRRHWERPLI
jgi:GT2 family glycosyltransferase